MVYFANMPCSASAVERSLNFIPGRPNSSRMRSPYGSSSRRERIVTLRTAVPDSMLSVVVAVRTVGMIEQC
jgi:hypothetical protein